VRAASWVPFGAAATLLVSAAVQSFHDRLKAEQDILEAYDVEETCRYITVRHGSTHLQPPAATPRHFVRCFHPHLSRSKLLPQSFQQQNMHPFYWLHSCSHWALTHQTRRCCSLGIDSVLDFAPLRHACNANPCAAACALPIQAGVDVAWQ
jgi:hypothetical protein